MKAITINNDVKLLKDLKSIKIGDNTFNNLKDVDDKTLYKWGFRNVKKPKINKNQKYDKQLNPGDFNESEDLFIYNIINKNKSEIDGDNDNNEDINIIDKKEIGKNYYNKNKRKLIRKLKKGILTQMQFDKLYTSTRKALIWCNTGDFDLALEEVSKLMFRNAKLQKIIDNIIGDLDEFLIK